jgi:hypothetical protein
MLFGPFVLGDPALTAKVAQARLAEVVYWSEIIIIGTPISISSESVPMRSATIAVEEVWRGNPERVIEVNLTRTWPCDSSTASVGEATVFFLSRSEGSWRIVHSGLGRFPISVMNGQRYCEIADNIVLMPDSLLRTGIPSEPGSDESFYELDALKRVVLQMIRRLEARTKPRS